QLVGKIPGSDTVCRPFKLSHCAESLVGEGDCNCHGQKQAAEGESHDPEKGDAFLPVCRFELPLKSVLLRRVETVKDGEYLRCLSGKFRCFPAGCKKLFRCLAISAVARFQLGEIFLSPGPFQEGELGKEILFSLPEKIAKLAPFEDRIFAGVSLLIDERVTQVCQGVHGREM